MDRPSTKQEKQISANLQSVLSRLVQVAESAGRSPGDVRLVAVSKTMPVSTVGAAYAAGQRIFGENRVQEMVGKVGELPADCEWHLIGPLQKNKVRSAVRAARWIHTLDSPGLTARIDRIAGEEGKRPNVLVQVNVSGEESKHGCRVEEARQVVEAAFAGEHLRCLGLMTIGPYGAPEDELRALFKRLRLLRDDLQQKTGNALPELSMGMSGDYEIAVEEGATLVRIGTAIFGHRN